MMIFHNIELHVPIMYWIQVKYSNNIVVYTLENRRRTQFEHIGNIKKPGIVNSP